MTQFSSAKTLITKENVYPILKAFAQEYKKQNGKIPQYHMDFSWDGNAIIYEKLDIQQQQRIKIIYNGNPCTTMNLCILAILTQNHVILDYEDNMRGINSFIIQTVNNLQTDKLVYLPNEVKIVDKIICIDNINKYNQWLRQNNKVKFYSLNYIDFYSDCDEYEEIEELIYKYAEENQISIEVYSELEVKDAVQMMKKGLGKMVVVLTNSNQTKQTFQENLTNKKLYINKNPFKENIRLIDKEIFKM